MVQRAQGNTSPYNLRKSYELMYLDLHERGKAVVFNNQGKRLYLPLKEIVIIKDRRQAFGLKCGDMVTVNMPEWLAEKAGLV